MSDTATGTVDTATGAQYGSASLPGLISQLRQSGAEFNAVILCPDITGDEKLPEAWVLHIPVPVGTLYLAFDPQGDGQVLKSTADGFWSWADATDEIDEISKTPEFTRTFVEFLTAA